ncbi:MAG: hypothetical protein ACPGC0_00800, partial [Opitutales bacterium]
DHLSRRLNCNRNSPATMQRLSSTLRLVALAAAISSIVIYFAARNSLAEKAEEVRLTERANEALVKELDDAVLAIKKLEEQIQSERNALAAAKQKLSEAQASLQSTLQSASITAAKLERTESQILGQKTELVQLRNKLLNAERKTSSTSQALEIERLEASINALSSENKRLSEALERESSLRLSIEDSIKNPVRKTGALLDPNYKPSLGENSARTEIASINRKNRIVVFSSLPTLKLEAGHEVRILSNRQLLGKARIFKVTDSYIVASLLADFNAEPIDAGRIVTIVH